MVERITTEAGGRVTGVAYVDASGQRIEIEAEVVVISAGAIETPRLLLNSASSAEPMGLGNANDLVGRNLQGHYYPGATGLFAEPVWDGIGPGPTTATSKFNHGNDGVIGGGMLADEFLVLPIIFWRRMLPPDLPRWGLANKTFMRERYRYICDVKGPVHEIPNPESRVTVDHDIRDRWGIPVARLSGLAHPETVRTAAFMHERAKEWMAASGAVKIWGTPPGLYLSAGQHQAGTCRMGDDPKTSVVDRWSRVHGHDNLFIADASVHTTNGGFNPVLTLMALALRTAETIARTW
jgi:choline dehydrogenase-like flavoprotein